MNLSFFAFVDESTDENIPTSTVVPMKSPTKRGEKTHITTNNGGYDLIGLDAITYKDEDDLVQQVNTILKELDV
jgi:hypothetical protein